MKDRYEQLQEQARLLQAKQFDKLDSEWLADEILAMSRSDKRELKSYLIRLIQHLIKLDCASPEQLKNDGKRWKNEVDTFREEIELLIEESPRFNNDIDEILIDIFNKLPRMCHSEKLNYLPYDCCISRRYTKEQLLDWDFYPTVE